MMCDDQAIVHVCAHTHVHAHANLTHMYHIVLYWYMLIAHSFILDFCLFIIVYVGGISLNFQTLGSLSQMKVLVGLSSLSIRYSIFCFDLH